MWLIALPGARVPRSRTAFLGGYEVDPVRVAVAGSATTGFYIPDDHPTAAETRAVGSRWPGMDVVEDNQVEILDAPKAPEPPSADVEAKRVRQMLYVQAIARGWSAEDLDGCWDGTPWTQHGDRASRTGLTLLESVQTRPPKDWTQLQSMGQAPWASADWTDPVQGWVPPAWTSPVRAEVEEPAAVASAADDEAPTAVMDMALADPDAPTLVSADLSQGGAVEDVADLSVEGTTWLYDPDQLTRALDVISGIVAQVGGKPNVRRNRVNSQLRKAGLKQLDTDNQLDWFLNQLPE